MKIVFATHNAHKVSEVQAVLGSEYQLVTATEAGITEEIPETQPTIEGNALQKARYVYEHTGLNCFADDTGLEVEALNGAPGVYSARYAGEHVSYADNNVLLLKNLAGCENRKARFRTVIALIVDGKEYLFEGVIKGEIIKLTALLLLNLTERADLDMILFLFRKDLNSLLRRCRLKQKIKSAIGVVPLPNWLLFCTGRRPFSGVSQL